MEGVVVRILAGVFTVNTVEGLYDCSVRGKLKLEDIPVVGDNVIVEKTATEAVIISILPRRNILERPKIANVDQMFIFMAATAPDPNNYLIDRLTVLGEYWQLGLIIGFNKIDLKKNELADIYRRLGYEVLEFSLAKDENLDVINELLKDKITVLAGPSGSGKTTLVNHLVGDIRRTGDVSEKSKRGKHTTRVVELIKLPSGGFIADTPGFSRLDVFLDNPQKLASCFRETQNSSCYFQNCRHLKEPGCSVREKMSPERYESYKQLLQEIEEMRPW